MAYRRAVLALLTALLAGTLACGSSSKLTSITLSPAAADANNYPNGQVQFTATGTYDGSKNPVTLHSLLWCISNGGQVCNGNIAAIATVTSGGLAQCAAGQSGTVTVLAGQGAMAQNPDGGYPFQISGSAQLTCP